MTDAKMNATLKVMNVATTGDARVAATYSVVDWSDSQCRWS